MSSTEDFNSPEHLARRKRVIRQRNVALGVVLGFFAVLFFAITIAKMKM
jgi:hypothetical protein